MELKVVVYFIATVAKSCFIGDEYTSDKSKLVESSLKSLHLKAKKSRQTKDADIDSNNTPFYEQGQQYKNVNLE